MPPRFVMPTKEASVRHSIYNSVGFPYRPLVPRGDKPRGVFESRHTPIHSVLNDFTGFVLTDFNIS